MSDDLKEPGSPVEGDVIDWYDRAYPADGAAVEGDDTVLDEDSAPPVASPWYRRAARRVVRRPVAWWQRPWTNERVVRVLVTSHGRWSPPRSS